MDHSNYEQHPHLPSGYWTGFYVYAQRADRHEMMIMLDFANGIISGNGSDGIGAFTFIGNYELSSMTCRFLKHYSSHAIDYHGHIDENGIWGKWYNVIKPDPQFSEELMNIIRKQFSGGFHIWPSNKEFSEYEMELRKIKEEEVVKLAE